MNIFSFSKKESSELPRSYETQRPVRLRTLVLIRWLAIAGQILTLIFLHLILGYKLPLFEALILVSFSVALNIIVSIKYPSSHRLSDSVAVAYLSYDTIQLACLLYLTGGLANPFSILFLAPVAVSATILNLRSIVMICIVAVICASILNIHSMPLPWTEGGLALPSIYLYGQLAAILVGIIFLSSYLWRIAADSRRMTDALVATQIELAREQKVSALGGLAAAAAHELGTPLGTITMAAKEMVGNVPPESDPLSDAKLIYSEALKCREILGRIAKGPDLESENIFISQDLESILREGVKSYQREGISVVIDIEKAKNLNINRRPEVIHGLTNLIENAIDFANTEVVIQGSVINDEIHIHILDDGPGFSYDVLSALGEPYISNRSDGEGLGLGIFISKTLLERTGALLKILNRSGGGASVEIIWPREALESLPKTVFNPNIDKSS